MNEILTKWQTKEKFIANGNKKKYIPLLTKCYYMCA